MSFINYATREIQLKIVYYGGGLCGKTTNLQVIHQMINYLHGLQTEKAFFSLVIALGHGTFGPSILLEESNWENPNF